MIALVRINNKKWMHNPPMGLLYVGGALRKTGFDTKIFHFSDEEIKHYAQLIAKKEPLFVGLSVFTGGDIGAAVDFSKELKKHYSGPILWAGIHPSLLPRETLKEDYVDLIIIGEGEKTIVELTKALEKKRSLKGILGLGYKEKNKLIINPPRPLLTDKELDDYKLDWDLVDVNKYIYHYFDVGKVISWITSRGCPYNCTFCYNTKFNQRRWRAHSVNSVVENIKKLKEEFDFEGIWFKDDNFIINRKRAVTIVEKLKMPYFVEASIDLIDENFAKRLNDTQCKEVGIGFESGSDRILKDVIRKPFGVTEIIKGIKILSNYPKIKIAGFLIFGIPGETREDFNKSLQLVIKLLKINPNINISAGNYLPYPGTELYNKAIKLGFRPPETTEDWKKLDRWSPDFELNWVDWLNSKEVFKIRKNIQVLISLSRYKVPILTSLAKYRLINENYFLDFDLKLLKKLRSIYMYGDENKFSTKVIRNMINKLTKQKRKYYWDN